MLTYVQVSVAEPPGAAQDGSDATGVVATDIGAGTSGLTRPSRAEPRTPRAFEVEATAFSAPALGAARRTRSTALQRSGTPTALDRLSSGGVWLQAAEGGAAAMPNEQATPATSPSTPMGR